MTATEAVNLNNNTNLSATGVLNLVERMNECAATECKKEINKIRLEYDDRDKSNIRIVSKKAAYLYTFRPMQDIRFTEVSYLSLYVLFSLLTY